MTMRPEQKTLSRSEEIVRKHKEYSLACGGQLL